MKKRISRVIAFFAFFLLTIPTFLVFGTQTAHAFGAGDGSEGSPYEVTSCADLTDVNNFSTAHFVLMQTLDCSADGNSVMIGGSGAFSGVFDGGNYTITVDLDVEAEYNVALFRAVNSGEVKNLTVNGSVQGNLDGAAMVVSFASEATLTNLHSSGTVTNGGNRAGGLVGEMGCNTAITDSDSSANVTGYDAVGGLVGYSNDDCRDALRTRIINSYATGSVEANGSVGGFGGEIHDTSVTAGYATGNVTGTGDNIGGFIGLYEASTRIPIIHSYATGSVFGRYYVGGFVGLIDEGSISQSYATGNVQTNGGDNIGGFAGSAGLDGKAIFKDSYARGDITINGGEGSVAGFIGEVVNIWVFNSFATGTPTSTTTTAKGGFTGDGSGTDIFGSFWDTETSGISEGCWNSANCGVTGRNTTQMKTESTFTGANWNFTTIWDIDGSTNDGYPFLQFGPDETYIPANNSTEAGPEETILGDNQFQGGGVAQEWKADDDEWLYDLPFVFNFYGQDYNRIYVSSNGYISFSNEEDNYDFYIEDGMGVPLISAISGDLNTDSGCANVGEDIYLTESEGSVTFRWLAADHRNCETVLNFEIVLRDDHSFQINYGDMVGDLDGVGGVGVHDGLESYVASNYNGRANFDELNSSSWAPAPIIEPQERQISTCEQLMSADEDTSRHDTITITQDINCEGVDDIEPLTWSLGFGGVLDGQGHTISNLDIEGDADVGLFSHVYGAEIFDVHFVGGSVHAESGYAGMLAGDLESTNVTNVSTTGWVNAINDGMAGGLLGFVTNEDPDFDMVLENLSSTGDVYSYDDGGGLIAEIEADAGKSITLRNSFATGDVFATFDDSGINFGGLVGDVESYAYEDGQSAEILIEDSYASGDVNGYDTVGGLLGDVSTDTNANENGNSVVTVRRTYSSGDVTAINSEAGGLIGEVDYNDPGELTTLENNFAAGEVQKVSDLGVIGGLVGTYEEEEESEVSGPIVSANNYFDSSMGLSCTGQDELDNCSGIDESEQPLYFKNNTTNQPLSEWDFDSVWHKRSTKYPILKDFDVDQDGVSDAIELAGPNNGDANNDGTPDVEQPNVASMINEITGEYSVLAVNDLCTINALYIISEDETSDAADVAYDYSAGLMDFSIDCGINGFTATINQYHYGIEGEFTVRKYKPSSGFFTVDGASTSNETIGGQSVLVSTYEVTDGSSLDLDEIENGVIEDPAGPALLTIGSPNTGLLRQ